MLKRATTKRERKYGKTETKELEDLPKKKKKGKIEKEEMYKILIDMASFTQPMPYSKCIEFINAKNERARKEMCPAPLMSLVKA